MQSKKGIFQQIREEPVYELNKQTLEEVLSSLAFSLKKAEKANAEQMKKRLKQLETNRIALEKKSEELGKEIPFEVAFHCYLSIPHTFVGTDFLEKYKEWFD